MPDYSKMTTLELLELALKSQTVETEFDRNQDIDIELLSLYYSIIAEIDSICYTNNVPTKSEQFILGVQASADVIRSEFARKSLEKSQSISDPNQIPLSFN